MFRLPTGASRGRVAEFRSPLCPILGDAATQVSCSPVMTDLIKLYSGFPSIVGIPKSWINVFCSCVTRLTSHKPQPARKGGRLRLLTDFTWKHFGSSALNTIEERAYELVSYFWMTTCAPNASSVV